MKELLENLKEFVKKRSWDQFHSPKNLAIALNIEAAELLEIFLWLSDNESINIDEKKLSSLQDEIGDVLIYLVLLAHKFDLNPVECAKNKIKKNEKKYPADLVKGKAIKYNEYSP